MTKALNSDVAIRLNNLGIELEGIKTIADAYAAIAKARRQAGAAQRLPNGAAGATLPTGKVDFKKQLEISLLEPAILEFATQAEEIGKLQEKLKDIQAGRISGGSPSKSSSGGGGSKSSSTKEIYKAEIDKYKELSDAVSAVQENIDRLNLAYDNTTDIEQQIKIKEQLITEYEAEKKALDALNKARDIEIAQNAEKLRKAGFQVEYDAISDSLQIKNREHLNDLSQKTIKEYEALIKKTDDLNTANKDSAKQWNELGYTISDTVKEISKLKTQQYEDYISDAEHTIELLGKRSDSTGKSIAIIQDMIDKTYSEWQRLTKEGYAANKSTIQKLESDWISYYDKRIQAEQELLEAQKDSKDSTINAVINLLDDQIKGIDDQIEALQKLNDERKEALDLQKAQAALDAAREQKTKRVLRRGLGFVPEADEDAIIEAQENLADIQYNNRISALEKEKEAIEEYKELWSSIPDEYEKAQNELIAEQELGAHWENKITDLRLSTYRSFKDDYFDLQDDIESKTEELNKHLNEEYINMVKIFEQMSTLMTQAPANNASLESMMSDEDKATIKAAQSAYNTAKAQGNKTAMDSAHAIAESIRDKYRTGSTSTSDITPSGTPITNAFNTTSYTKQPYELVSSTKTGGSSSGGNSSLKAEYERQLSLAKQNFKAYNGGSAFTGDKAFSAPDYNYIKAFQSAYNIAKGNNDKDSMANAHRGAEEIRDKYRYYPTADTDGYGLGKNDIGFIRDMTVRYDDLGNKTIDEYGRSSVASRTYNPDGSLQYSHVSGSPAKHNAWVQNDIKDDKNGYFARLYDNSHQGLDRGSLEGLYSGDNGISSNSYYNGGDGNIYGGGDAYKSRLESAIAREVSGAGHTIETYNNGTTTSTIVKATNQAEANMSASDIQKKYEASVKNNTGSLDKVNSGLKGNTNATEYAGDAMYDASDTISESTKAMAESNKETANSFASALSSFVGSLGSSSSSGGGSSKSSSKSSGSSAFSAIKKLASSATSAVKSIVSKLTSSKKKASGGINLPADTYNTDELGDELKIEPQQGNWVTVTNGTSILPADISKNLMNFGSDPTAYLRQMSANQIAGVTRIDNNTSAPVINNYNVQATLPNVKDPYDFLDTLPQLARQYAAKR